MSIQFPSPASQGDTFTASNGVIYTYDNGGWTANSVSGLDATYVNISGDTMTGDLTVPSLNGGPLAGLRNQLINGDFRVWQRGTDNTYSNTASGGYNGADRFHYSKASGGIGPAQRIARSTTAPVGFDYSSLITGSVQGVQQGIEVGRRGQPFGIGTTWTMSGWFTQPPVGGFVRWRAAVGDDADSTDAAVFGTWASTGKTSNGFTQYSTTFTITTAPSSTQICLNIRYQLTTDVDQSFTGLQLEPGPVATPFEQRPIALELSLCQRYLMAYTATTSGSVGTLLHSVVNASSSSGTETSWQASLGVTAPWMRIKAPTVSFAGDTTGLTLRARSGSASISIASIAASDIYKGIFSITVGTATDPSTKIQIRGNQGSGLMLLSCEL